MSITIEFDNTCMTINANNANDKNMQLIRNSIKKLARCDIRKLQDKEIFALWIMYKSKQIDRFWLQEMTRNALKETQFV